MPPLPQPDITDEQLADNLSSIDRRLGDVQAAARKRLTATEADILAIQNSYRNIQAVGAGAPDTLGSGTYVFGGGVTNGIMSGAAVTIEGFVPIYFDDADYSLTGMTPKLRLRAMVMTNGTAPAITYTFTLKPITVGGGADALSVTPGTTVTGSSVAIATPSANSVTSGDSTDFDVPSDGAHALCVTLSGSPTANAAVWLTAQLQVRNV